MKYMGSKSRIAKYIVPIIQSYITNETKGYIEPFVGGANVIDKIKCDNKYGCDKNKYLIALLNRVKDSLPLYETVDRELYNKARSEYRSGNITSFEDWQIGNIGFLASYNGKWFDGGYAKSGYEKTKTGERFRDYYKESKQNLLNQAEDLKDIMFYAYDYVDLPEFKDYVIYCDIPYKNTTSYKIANNFDYDYFWKWVKKLSENNIVIVSEETAPNEFTCIWQQEVSRSLNAKNKKVSTEKLFIYR